MNLSLSRNIPLLYVLKFSKWFSLWMPVIVPFYSENGLDMQAILELKAIYSAVIMLMEIPSGYLGDFMGRKRSLLLGSTLVFAGFVVYSGGESFWHFVLAEVVLGIGASFISGSDSALLYDTLIAQKQHDSFVKYEGRMYAIGNFAEAVAGILGGLIAILSLRYTFYGQTLVSLTGVVAAFFMIEAPRMRLSGSEASPWGQIKEALRFSLIQNRRLRGFLLLASLSGMGTILMAWFAQPYFELAEIPLVYYGALWTALNLSVGFSAWFAHRVKKRLSQSWLLAIPVLMIAAGFLGAGSFDPVLGLVMIFVLYLGRGVVTPVMKDFINELTPSGIRATVLSIRSFLVRMFFAGFAPLLGYVTDSLSIQTALLLTGTIYLFASLVLLVVLGNSTSKADPV